MNKNVIQTKFYALSAIILSIIFFSTQHRVEAQATGPLRVLSSNPRYFTDGSGKAIYLTGSETQINFKDWGYTDPPPVFDYNEYLDFLQKHNHNFIRLWTMDETEYDKTNDSTGQPDTIHVSPFPWPRTGPGTAQDGKPKFDLQQLDQSYFDRLRRRVADAGARGIYVSIMLFEGNIAYGTPNSVFGHPFHAANNINGINVDRNGDGKPIEAYSLDIPAITAIQDTYVRKVIDSVHDLDNVLFEICNECNPGGIQWQYHMIDLIHSYDGNRHPVGMSSDYAANYEALYASNADWIAPPRNESGYDNLTNPMPADGTKVIIMDADHICYFDCNASMLWRQFLRGNNTVFIDLAPPLRDKAPLPEQELIRSTMGYTLTYANKMNLAAMTPRGDLASTGYALANPGVEYLVFLPGGGSTTVDLSGASGSFNVEWMNAANGATQAGNAVNGGSQIIFTAPFSGDAVLYLQNGGGRVSGCTNLLSSTLAVPASFAASFNWVSSAKEVRINVVCSADSAIVNVGKGLPTEYIYKTGYTWQNSQWTPFNYFGSNMESSGNWFIGNAHTSLSSIDATVKQSVLAYICDWNGSQWNCGCHDSACTTNYWNLQQFQQ
jgi:hypothetical protein